MFQQKNEIHVKSLYRIHHIKVFRLQWEKRNEHLLSMGYSTLTKTGHSSEFFTSLSRRKLVVTSELLISSIVGLNLSNPRSYARTWMTLSSVSSAQTERIVEDNQIKQKLVGNTVPKFEVGVSLSVYLAEKKC